MYRKHVLAALLCFIVFAAVPQIARAATITSCAPNKNTYTQGETGYLAVTVYNDEDEKVRVTELSATIDYYYSDGVVYLQKFFTDTNLPYEIAVGQSTTFNVPISLPNNIAPGYLNPYVEARTEIWSEGGSRWATSERPTYSSKFYVESPYKQLYETSNNEYLEQRSLTDYFSSMMNMFVVTTIVFALASGAAFFVLFMRRMRPTPQA